MQEHVNIRLSGEKMNVRGREGVFGENSRCWSRPRIFESSMVTVTGSAGLIARYLLHSDHTTSLILKEHPVARVAESHDAGSPYTVLIRGLACAS